MVLRSLRFLCLFFTSLALGLALAHLFHAPNKIYSSVEGYQAVRRIYFNWMMLEFIVACAMVTISVLTITVRKRRKSFICALIALLCLAGAELLFWKLSYSANQATGAWAMLPANWPELCQEWVYLYAPGGVLILAALASLNFSLILPEASGKSALSETIASPISRAQKDAHAQFLQDVASFHASWYEVRLKEFRRINEENQGRMKATAA
jgi:hypothetical protein